MSVSRVKAEEISADLKKRSCAIDSVFCNSDCRAADEAAVCVLRGIWISCCLFDVFYRNKAAETVFRIHKRELFDLVLSEYLLSLRKRCADRGGNKVVLCHDVADPAGIVGQKAHIAVCDDADELSVNADRHTGYLIFRHQCLSLADVVVRGKEERVDDDAVFAPLDAQDVVHLRLDRHIFVNDTRAALSCDGNCKVGLGNGVHSGGQKRDVQPDPVCQTGREVDVSRKDFAF